MKLNVAKEAAGLQRLSMHELRTRFAAVFGEATRVGNRAWLVKRILWRLQVLAEGDLSERARLRAVELANDADLRLNAPLSCRPASSATPKPPPAKASTTARPRTGQPMPGTIISRTYKGKRLEVRVLAEGFAFEGTVFSSLSAVAQAITGAHWNGRLFFGLTGKRGDL